MGCGASKKEDAVDTLESCVLILEDGRLASFDTFTKGKADRQLEALASHYLRQLVSRLSIGPGDNGDVDLTALRLLAAPDAEQQLAQRTALGQVVAAPPAEAAPPGAAAPPPPPQPLAPLPFGRPVAAAISCINARCTQAAKNSANCAALWALVLHCDEQLAEMVLSRRAAAVAEKARQPKAWAPETRAGMRAAMAALCKALLLVCEYSVPSFLLRAISSSEDPAAFQSCDAGLRKAMQDLCVPIKVVSASYADEGAAYAVLRAEFCKAAAMPDTKVHEAYAHLQQLSPAGLKVMIRKYVKPSDDDAAEKALLQELEAAGPKAGCALDIADGGTAVAAGSGPTRVSKLQSLIVACDAAARRPPPALKQYLVDFWYWAGWLLDSSATTADVVEQLTLYLASLEGDAAVLGGYDAQLQQEDSAISHADGSQSVFLQVVHVSQITDDLS